ncbi:hypothetical protein VP01_1213g3 [Puccinia sorghi]|uniref:Uncharacterized protein n=1 Tax=Puccinia sorghi TaxID=27349 RepID=A0A0L6VQ97_9BASI|nr:hypothetical protein VP01_1213g3 [Puccinia sorghi]
MVDCCFLFFLKKPKKGYQYTLIVQYNQENYLKRDLRNVGRVLVVGDFQAGTDRYLAIYDIVCGGISTGDLIRTARRYNVSLWCARDRRYIFIAPRKLAQIRKEVCWAFGLRGTTLWPKIRTDVYPAGRWGRRTFGYEVLGEGRASLDESRRIRPYVFWVCPPGTGRYYIIIIILEESLATTHDERLFDDHSSIMFVQRDCGLDSPPDWVLGHVKLLFSTESAASSSSYRLLLIKLAPMKKNTQLQSSAQSAPILTKIFTSSTPSRSASSASHFSFISKSHSVVEPFSLLAPTKPGQIVPPITSLLNTPRILKLSSSAPTN